MYIYIYIYTHKYADSDQLKLGSAHYRRLGGAARPPNDDKRAVKVEQIRNKAKARNERARRRSGCS